MASEELVLFIEHMSVFHNELKHFEVMELLYARPPASLPTEVAPLKLVVAFRDTPTWREKACVMSEATKVKEAYNVEINLLTHQVEELKPNQMLKQHEEAVVRKDWYVHADRVLVEHVRADVQHMVN